MSKRAIILVGGEGRRLKPYTLVLPKPLMPVGDLPILEIIVKQLSYFGFTHITFAVNHQADLIKAFFKNGKKWKIKIDYSKENSPLGTIGPLTLIKNLPNEFLVMNGDILTDLNFGNFYENHVKMNNLFTISSFERKQNIDFGVLGLSDRNLIKFDEKPNLKFEVSMGIYMISKSLLNFIPKKMSFGFDTFILKLLKNKIQVKVAKHVGIWLDIGRHEDYEQSSKIFQKNKKQILHI